MRDFVRVEIIATQAIIGSQHM